MNVLIVEDELHTANLLQEIIEQDPAFMVVEKVESVAEAVQYLSKYQKNLDLLFFDIQLADGPSFEIFKHIDINIPVVFCTAYDSYAMEAIKNNGIDYVLKPFKTQEIHNALAKYKGLVQNLAPKQPTPTVFETPQQYQQVFITQQREKSIIKRAPDIALFTIAFNTVYFYTLDGTRYPFYKKLEYVEGALDPEQFFRVNRQMIINKAAVVAFVSYENRKVGVELTFKAPEPIIVSRLKVTEFKEWLEK